MPLATGLDEFPQCSWGRGREARAESFSESSGLSFPVKQKRNRSIFHIRVSRTFQWGVRQALRQRKVVTG